MFKIFTTLLFIMAIFNGCNKQNEVHLKTKSNDSSSLTRTDTIVKNITIDIYEGLYVVNINSSTFQDCAHPDSIYWVAGNSKKLVDQYNRIIESPSVYASVVAKVTGELENTKDTKVKDKYPRTLRVKEVMSVEKKNFTNTCIPYDYWAFGNNPGWSLEVSAKENLIEFSIPSEKKTYYFFYAEQKQRDGYIIYSNYNTIQRNSIEVKIKKEECTDTSDSSYQYSVQVELPGNRIVRGCAIKGKNPDIE